MSQKTLIVREIDLINDIIKNNYKFQNSYTYDNLDKNTWYWTDIKKTLLFKYLKDNNKKFTKICSEGLTLNYNSCEKILNFMDKFPKIKDDIFNFNSCMEEFALQCITINHNEPLYHLGIYHTHLCNEKDLPKNKFMCRSNKYI